MGSDAVSDGVNIGVWVISVGFVVVAVVLDLTHNPYHHKRKFVNFRLINWFLMGFSYALTYFARYNVNIINIPRIRDELDVSASGFGWIITVGFWGYAVFVIINGMMVDRLGARKAVLLGSIGSGLCNIILGFFFKFSHATGTTLIVLVCFLCGVNNYAQTYSTAAIVKAGVNWYPVEERGFFGGIFGVIIAFGFFLAYQVNGTILAHMHYSWVFFIPGIAEVCAFAVSFFVIRSTPWHAGFNEKDMGRLVPPPGEATARPPILKLIRRVFLNRIFVLFCVAEICIGWCRDGILSWISDYLASVYDVHAGDGAFALASGGITIGGMFGSLSAGIASDVIFRSRRTPVAFLYSLGLLGMLLILFFVNNAWVASFVIGFISLFFSGAHGIVTSTCAMDFAGSEATGTAVGLLDGIQKMASSATGSAMGKIVEQGHKWWIFSMMPAAFVASLVFLILIGKKGKRTNRKDVDEDLNEDGMDVDLDGTNNQTIKIAKMDLEGEGGGDPLLYSQEEEGDPVMYSAEDEAVDDVPVEV